MTILMVMKSRQCCVETENECFIDQCANFLSIAMIACQQDAAVNTENEEERVGFEILRFIF